MDGNNMFWMNWENEYLPFMKFCATWLNWAIAKEHSICVCAFDFEILILYEESKRKKENNN